MASASTAPASPPRAAPSGVPRTSVKDLPLPVLGCILQHARKGTRGKQFLAYATVSKLFLRASLASVRGVFLTGAEAAEALRGGLDRFEELTFVHVEGYQGCELAEDMGSRLGRVETLVLKSCPNLKAIPSSFGEMSSLKSLILWNLPALACLPPSVGRLAALENLEVYDCNSIKEIPDDVLAALTSLKKLKSSVPCQPSPALTTLQYLEEVDLTGVRFPHIPELLGRIPRLRSLTVRCNFLVVLPPGFPSLETLWLYVDGDPYDELVLAPDRDVNVDEDEDSDEVQTVFTNTYRPLPSGSYPRLKHLTVKGGARFAWFPPMIFELTTLLSLDASTDDWELNISDDISKLVQLETLSLGGRRKYCDIPEGIASTWGLKSVTVYGRLGSIRMPSMRNLELLDVAGCAGLGEVLSPDGLVAVREIRVTCDHSSDMFSRRPSELFSGTVFRGLQVLKVTHRCGYPTCTCGDDISEGCNCNKDKGHVSGLPSTMPRMTDLQVLDLSAAPCVLDFSNAAALPSLREVKLSPTWPYGLPNIWQARVAAARSALGLLNLPSLGEESKGILRRRCKEVIQDVVSREHLDVEQTRAGLPQVQRLAPYQAQEVVPVQATVPEEDMPTLEELLRILG